MVELLIRSRSLRMLLSLVAAGLAGWAWFHAVGGADGVRERYGLHAALVLVPLLAVVAASPLPSEAVAMVNGLIYGITWAAALNWLGWMLAGYLQYGVAARIADDLEPRWRARIPRRLRELPAEHPAFLIMARYLPWGSHIVNTTAGAHRVPLWTFTWCTAISLIPVAIVFAALGSALDVSG